jgi:hypothetical protein
LPSIAAVATVAAWEQPTYAEFLRSLSQKKAGWGAPAGRIAAMWNLCPALTAPSNGSIVCDNATCALVCDDGKLSLLSSKKQEFFRLHGDRKTTNQVPIQQQK